MKTEDLGLCVVHDFKRIERDAVHYDQRSKFNHNIGDFERAIKERKTIEVEDDEFSSISDIDIPVED